MLCIKQKGGIKRFPFFLWCILEEEQSLNSKVVVVFLIQTLKPWCCRYETRLSSAIERWVNTWNNNNSNKNNSPRTAMMNHWGEVNWGGTRCMACSFDAMFVAPREARRSSASLHLLVTHLLLLFHFSFDFGYVMVVFSVRHLHDCNCLKD